MFEHFGQHSYISSSDPEVASLEMTHRSTCGEICLVTVVAVLVSLSREGRGCHFSILDQYKNKQSARRKISFCQPKCRTCFTPTKTSDYVVR